MNAKVVSTDVAGNLASAKKNAEELSTIFDEYVFVEEDLTISFDEPSNENYKAIFCAGLEL